LRHNIGFQCWAPNDWTDADVANASLDCARESFGKEIDDAYTVRQWKLVPQQLPKALDLFFTCSQWPQQKMGPVILNICYDFHWRAFENDSVNKSILGVTFNSQKIFLQPTFVFPFAWNAREHLDWLNQIMTNSPFRFRDQYFKRNMPAKIGTGYRTVKLPKDWRIIT
jgi:hypothetical protein